MKELKKYVRNRARPEGCIAECYIANEYVKFCKNSDGTSGRSISNSGPVGKSTVINLNTVDYWAAHNTVLFNTEQVTPYIQYVIELVMFLIIYGEYLTFNLFNYRKHMNVLKLENPMLANDPDQLRTIQFDTFAAWYREEVSCVDQTSD
jgi:ABC-type branched-subunit amino acid transport system ATPase component